MAQNFGMTERTFEDRMFVGDHPPVFLPGTLSGGSHVSGTVCGILTASGKKVQLDPDEAAVAAQGTISMIGIAVADETFVIDDQTFTWKAARGGTGEVTIGADAAAAAANIVTAVTADLTTVVAEQAGNDVVITAAVAGADGNAIVLTEDSTNMTVDGSGTLGGTTEGRAINGSQEAACILLGDVDASEDDEPAVFMEHGVAIDHYLTWPDEITENQKAAAIAELKAIGIYVK
ncbi:head decoration protein [Desulfotignum phosphitoxidans]|uniref:Bacteriophage lambda head decoration protein D n=1 Tax=Desulfotignum phosphitoxidans DSM 13687 TaxID=1286635 RepID=S0G571_9BACT|nr:head decoration protein [Desulfotignum phosphitoxidans]EMS79201.1 bacteriophage lambda head decoration protein D [Desulfotignum phosphitoxidans DSM 13687]